MKEHLKDLKNSINGLLFYSDQNARRYIQLLNEAAQVIEAIEEQPNAHVNMLKLNALEEISSELTNRVHESFFSSNVERKKMEFKFSKAIVLLAVRFN